MTATATDSYLDLVRRFPLRPIRSDEELEAAVAVSYALDCRGDLDPDEQDYVDVLCSLIRQYEDANYPMEGGSGPDTLRALIEFRQISQADVARGTGIRDSALSEILAGRRPMGRQTIEKFAVFFKVDPGVFMKPARGS